jgi:hypothetical protein
MEHGEEDWGCPLCNFLNKPRTMACCLCGISKDDVLLDYAKVALASREVLATGVSSSKVLSDRQLRAARRLGWRREDCQQDRQRGLRGSSLDNWKWVRNRPTLPAVAAALGDESVESVKATVDSLTPRSRRGGFFGMFGPSEQEGGSMREPLLAGDSVGVGAPFFFAPRARIPPALPEVDVETFKEFAVTDMNA